MKRCRRTLSGAWAIPEEDCLVLSLTTVRLASITAIQAMLNWAKASFEEVQDKDVRAVMGRQDGFRLDSSNDMSQKM